MNIKSFDSWKVVNEEQIQRSHEGVKLTTYDSQKMKQKPLSSILQVLAGSVVNFHVIKNVFNQFPYKNTDAVCGGLTCALK